MAESSVDTQRDAAAGLRRLLDAVEDGRLVVETPRDIALIRRIEGAAIALDAYAAARSDDPKVPASEEASG